jgi:hypothetical protein
MKRITYLSLCLLLISQMTFGQNVQLEQQVPRLIESHVTKGTQFKSINFFSISREMPYREDVNKEVGDAHLMYLNAKSMEEMQNAAPEGISMSLPSMFRENLNLILIKTDIYTEDFVVNSDIGPQDVKRGVHYRGIIEGNEHSIASISVFENELIGMVSIKDQGTIVIGKLQNDNPENVHIIYNDNNLKNAPTYGCHTPDDFGSFSEENIVPHNFATRASRCVSIYFEVDNDIYKAKGSSVTATENFVSGFFNQVSTLYNNEGINISLREVYIWTRKQQYRGTSASSALSKFQSNRASYFNEDLAGLVNFSVSGGIAAGFSGLCNSNRASSMCVSGIDNSYATVPTYSWTVDVVAHEFGHLHGSRHTHACVWNGNNTAIDGCYNVEGGCPTPGLPSGGGTIMSYCHLQSVGKNLSNGFHPQVSALMNSRVDAATCLPNCGPNSCNNGIQDGGEAGIDCGGTCGPCPKCDDNIKNGNEEGVDCGGDCPVPCPTSCDTPSGLFANGIKGDKVKLNWASVSGVNEYIAEIRAVGGSWQSFTSATNNVSLQGASRNVTYEWRVTSSCSGILSEPSVICSFVGGDRRSGDCGSALPENSIEVYIYPNPVNEKIIIEFYSPTKSDTEIHLRDMLGRTVKSVTLGKNFQTTEIVMSDIIPGIYILQLERDDIIHSKKIIKK